MRIRQNLYTKQNYPRNPNWVLPTVAGNILRFEFFGSSYNNIKIFINGAWREVTACKILVQGNWKDLNPPMQISLGGQWKSTT